MLTLKEWMELTEYRVTEGSDYGWRCFGDDAYSLSSWNGDHDGWSSNIVFDTKTQEVYTVEVCDYRHQRAYRIINPDYRQAYLDEAKAHEVNEREAWDDVDFVDLDVDDDFVQKGLAIRSGEDYDTRVSIPVDFPDDMLFALMKQAHEQDITFNQHVENILKVAIDRVKAGHPDVDWSDWDDLAEDHWDDDGNEPAPAMKKAKKSKGKKK
jgi:hypothetical protein